MAHVLAVGVSKYQRSSNFDDLRQCIIEAQDVERCFKNVHQLAGHPAHVDHLLNPARGTLIGAVRTLATETPSSDRLVFYYSGHGHRLGDELYLVPSDAYCDDEADALVPFSMVLQLISASQARHKLVFLDACWTGPILSSKKLHVAKYSEKFLSDMIARSQGSVTLASSRSDQASWAKSPNPDQSLFTHFLVKALQGDQEALDDGILTVASLYDYVYAKVARVATSYHRSQEPTIEASNAGVLVLGDFRKVFDPAQFDPTGYPISEFALLESEPLRTKDVLTRITNFKYSIEYIERTVNGALGESFREELGEKAAAVRTATGISAADIVVNEAGVDFPGGSYFLEFSAEDQKSGTLTRTLALEKEWLERPEQIPTLVEAFGMSPEAMRLRLSCPIAPPKLLPGLEANGWQLKVNLPERVKVTRDGITLTVTDDAVHFSGLLPSDLFGKPSEKGRLAVRAIALLPHRVP